MRACHRPAIALALALVTACSPAPRTATPAAAGPAAADASLESALDSLDEILVLEAATPEAEREVVARLAEHAETLRRPSGEDAGPAAERLADIRAQALLRLRTVVLDEMPAEAPGQGPEAGPEESNADAGGEADGELEDAAADAEWPALSPSAEDALVTLVALASPESFAALAGIPVWDELVGDLASDDAGVRAAAFDDCVSGGRALRALLGRALAGSGGRLRASVSVGRGVVRAGEEVRYSYRYRMRGGAGWVCVPASGPVARANPCANRYLLADDGDKETGTVVLGNKGRDGEAGHLMARWALFLDGDSLESATAGAKADSPGVVEIAFDEVFDEGDPEAGAVTLPAGDAEEWAVTPAPVEGSTVEVPVLPRDEDLGAPSGGLVVEVVEFAWSEEDDGGLWPELIVHVRAEDGRRHVTWMPVALIPGPFYYVLLSEDGVFAGASDPETRTLVTERGGKAVPGTVVLGKGGLDKVEGFCLLPDLPDGRYVAYVGFGGFALDSTNPATLADLWTGRAFAKPFAFEVLTPEMVEFEEE